MLAFIFIVGLLFAGGGGYMIHNYGEKIRNCTEPIDGVVVKCTTSGGGRRGGRRSKMAGIYYATVSYSLKGTEYRHACNGGGTEYPIGQSLPLMYNPEKPGQCYAVKDKNAHRITGPLCVLIGIGAMIGAFFLP